MHPSLFNGYQIVEKQKRLDEHTEYRLLTDLHPKIDGSYYLRHPEHYYEDQGYLRGLNDYCKGTSNLCRITINERSFQVFGDEKFLASSHGQAFLQRLSLSLEDIRCYATHEPFFYFQVAPPAETMSVLVIELH